MLTAISLSFPQELMKHGVHDVVRVCEPTYKTDELKKAGISVMDLVFDDGTFPPAEVRVTALFPHSLYLDFPQWSYTYNLRQCANNEDYNKSSFIQISLTQESQ